MKAISFARETLIKQLIQDLNLLETPSPLFIPKGTGVQDTLSDIKTPSLGFKHKLLEHEIEIPHSLAKWKRLKVNDLEMDDGEGILVIG